MYKRNGVLIRLEICKSRESTERGVARAWWDSTEHQRDTVLYL